MVDNSAKHFRFRSFYLFCQDFDDVEVTRVSMQAFLSFSKPLDRTVTDTTTTTTTTTTTLLNQIIIDNG